MMTRALRVGIVKWSEEDGISTPISKAANELGYQVINFLGTERLPDRLDVLLVCGNRSSLVPLTHQLLALPSATRPVVALCWFDQELPNPYLPEWFRYRVAKLRSRVERMAFCPGENSIHLLNDCLRWLTSKAHRFRYYGDIHWLRNEGLLSVLAIPSPWQAQFLQDRGFNPLVTYFAAAPEWGADLHLERDIPVLWLGQPGSSRRSKLLKRIQVDLLRRGIEMYRVDGIEHPYVFDDARTVLLNRAKIVLNILRQPWDDNSTRYYLAALNRALIVTEPTLPHTRFLSGQHLVEVPLDQLTNTIDHYLSHEEERQRIVEQAYRLVTIECTMKQMVGRVLEQAAIVRLAKQ